MRRLQARARQKIEEGDLNAALSILESAVAIDLFEIPNYEPFLDLAEVRCRLGDLEGATALLADVECMLGVDAGETACYVGQPTAGAPGQPNSRLTPRCYLEMCGEALLDYYVDPPEEMLARVIMLRERSVATRASCRQPTWEAWVRPLLSIQYDGAYSRSTLGVSVRIQLDEQGQPLFLRVVGYGETGRSEEVIDLGGLKNSCSFSVVGRQIGYGKPVFHFEPGEELDELDGQTYSLVVVGGEIVSTDGDLPGHERSADEWLIASVGSAAHLIAETIPFSRNWHWIDEWVHCVSDLPERGAERGAN